MIKKLIIKNLHFLIFIILSFVPFLWYPLSFYKNYLYLGSGDFISPINIGFDYYYRLFVYNPLIYGGIDVGFLVSSLFSEYALFFILNLFKISPFLISIIYISIIIFISEIGMYYFFLFILESKLKLNIKLRRLFAIIAGILFGFSPHIVGLLPPGHFRQLIPYSLLPFILIIFHKLIKKRGDKFSLFFSLFLIFLFSSSAFGNIGIIYALLLTTSFYVLLNVIVEGISPIKASEGFLYIIFALITANIWWIPSFINSFKQLIRPDAVFSSSNLAIRNAVTNASIINFLLGKPETQLYLLNNKYYINGVAQSLFILLSIFLLLCLIKLYKQRSILILLIMTLLGIFISKGPKQPISWLFMWFYNNIYGFQIFRRPVSKYYGIFVLFYIILSIIGIADITRKLSYKKLILLTIIPLIVACGYFVFIFTKNNYLVPFNIPKYYYQAQNFLSKENVNKILILPSLFGLQPSYNKSINNLYASDFLTYIWKYSLISPDISNTSPEEPHRMLINKLMLLIRNKKSFCDLTKQIGISHIMVRQDLSDEAVIADKPQVLIDMLDMNKAIEEKREFKSKEYKGFIIYQLKKDCRSDIIQISKANTAKIDYSIINPIKIKINIMGLKAADQLIYLSNFRSSWKLYFNQISPYFISSNYINRNFYSDKKRFFEGDEIALIWKNAYPEKYHTIKNGYANGWKIDPSYIKATYSDKYYRLNPDGSINIQLTLYYQIQSYFYLGILLFICILIFIISVLVKKIIIIVFKR